MLKLLTILLVTSNLFLASTFTVKVNLKPSVSNMGTTKKQHSTSNPSMSLVSTEKADSNSKDNIDRSSSLDVTRVASHLDSRSKKVVMLSDQCGPGCTCSRCMFGM